MIVHASFTVPRVPTCKQLNDKCGVCLTTCEYLWYIDYFPFNAQQHSMNNIASAVWINEDLDNSYCSSYKWLSNVHTWGRYMYCAYVGQVHVLCVRGAGTCTVGMWGRYTYCAYVGQVHVLCIRGAGTCRCRMALESLIHGARNLWPLQQVYSTHAELMLNHS